MNDTGDGFVSLSTGDEGSDMSTGADGEQYE